MWLPWPRFYAPLHNFTPIWGPSGIDEPSVSNKCNFWLILLCVVCVCRTLLPISFYVLSCIRSNKEFEFVNNGHRNSIQRSNLCNVPKKQFLKSLSISNEILSKKFGIRGTPDYQSVTSKGFENNMGSEWPDKRNKTEFGSVARVGGFSAWSSSLAQQCGFWGGLSNGAVLPVIET